MPEPQGAGIRTSLRRTAKLFRGHETIIFEGTGYSLALSLEPLPGGPVLLVDDMVDSRWTLTVVAWLLRSNGSGEVWPLALALAGQDR